MKQCTKCKEVKAITEFGVRVGVSSGRSSQCKFCRKDYYNANRPHFLQTGIERAKKNKDAKRVKDKERYVFNSGPAKSRAAAFRAENPEKVVAYRESRRLELAAQAASYRARNPERARAAKGARRARILGNGGSCTAKDIAALMVLQKHKCPVCRRDIGKEYHADHINPLARGGAHDRVNLQLLCPNCNLKKNAKDPIQFMQERGFLL